MSIQTEEIQAAATDQWMPGRASRPQNVSALSTDTGEEGSQQVSSKASGDCMLCLLVLCGGHHTLGNFHKAQGSRKDHLGMSFSVFCFPQSGLPMV